WPNGDLPLRTKARASCRNSSEAAWAIASASSFTSASWAAVKASCMALSRMRVVDFSPKRLFPDLCTKIPPGFETPPRASPGPWWALASRAGGDTLCPVRLPSSPRREGLMTRMPLRLPAVLLAAGPLPAAEPARRTNVLLILADDLGYETVGANGG